MSVLLIGKGDGTFDATWPNKSGLIVKGDAMGLATTDINQDGRPDFVIGINDGNIMTFEHQGQNTGELLTVKLIGHPGNINAVGSKVSLVLDNGTAQTAEVQAGGGYLSQSSATLTFGRPGQSTKTQKIIIRWPNGQETSFDQFEDTPSHTITIKQP